MSDEQTAAAHKVTWLGPNRPVEGGTVFIKPEAETYTCNHCYRSAPWTDGRSIATGDPVDEFWCTTCGTEQPLPQPDSAGD